MTLPVNTAVAGRLEEVATILEEHGANRFRVAAYRRGAATVRGLERPVDQVLREDGLEGLERLPGIGLGLARSIRDLVATGRLPMLERLRGETDPVELLRSVPGIGRVIADVLHHDLGIDTLEELESAAHDGRLQRLAGFGEKRLAGVRDSLAQRLGRVRRGPTAAAAAPRPPVAELLGVDAEYRSKAERGQLQRIAPRRFNPGGDAWLPILHATRGARHYTALFSNTPRARRLGATHDWVILYYDGPGGESQSTVITARDGTLAGLRIVRGREAECAEHYSRDGRVA